MIGTDPENSDLNYDTGIIGNGSGQGDVTLKFNEKTPSKLFIFCPDQKRSRWSDFGWDPDQGKPNQGWIYCLLFPFDQPKKPFKL